MLRPSEYSALMRQHDHKCAYCNAEGQMVPFEGAWNGDMRLLVALRTVMDLPPDGRHLFLVPMGSDGCGVLIVRSPDSVNVVGVEARGVQPLVMFAVEVSALLKRVHGVHFGSNLLTPQDKALLVGEHGIQWRGWENRMREICAEWEAEKVAERPGPRKLPVFITHPKKKPCKERVETKKEKTREAMEAVLAFLDEFIHENKISSLRDTGVVIPPGSPNYGETFDLNNVEHIATKAEIFRFVWKHARADAIRCVGANGNTLCDKVEMFLVDDPVALRWVVDRALNNFM